MKKSEIKRRKRVVPAFNDQHLVHQYAQSPNEASVSPDPTMGAFQSEGSAHPMDYRVQSPTPYAPPTPSQQHTRINSKPQRMPVAVDFTNYFGRPSQPESISDGPSPNPRKRSFSASEEGEGSRHAAPPVQAARSNVENIDPSLSSMTANTPGDLALRSREERKAALEREAARMREMLLAKEREIADLGRDAG